MKSWDWYNKKEMKKLNFKFKITSHKDNKLGFIKRFIARKMAKIIYNSSVDTYQFGGWTGALKKSYELVDADKFQLIHWLLNSVGYECCVDGIREHCGLV